MENVKIKFILGASSTPRIPNGYNKIAELHHVEISINPEATWLEAIQNNFGISLNPESYIIQRHASREVQHPRRRCLTEKIGEWLTKDFSAKYSQALYRAELFTVAKAKRGRPLGSSKSKKAKNRKTKKLCPPVESESPSPVQKAKGLGALYIFKCAEVVLENGDLNTQLTPLHEQSFRIKDPLMTWDDIFSKHFGVNLDPEQHFVRHSFPRMKEHDLREPVQHLLQEFPTLYQNKSNIILVARQPAKKSSPKARKNNATNRPKRNFKRKQPPPPVPANYGSESPIGDFEETDDEDENMQPKVRKVSAEHQKPIASQIPKDHQKQASFILAKGTSGSAKPDKRESQSEDIRKEVYNLAAKFTNSQLLKAKREILKLKEISQGSETRDPWSDWNTACPLPAAILRDLFDV